MKKRLLPIPLILLIPIVLLVIVTAAGLYRFSLSDEEILAKFPSSQQTQDEIIKAVFARSTPNPWTINVPESHAFSFIDSYDEQSQLASGKYDDGAQRGTVTVFTHNMLSVNQSDYVAVMSVSNQGSGVFYYLSRFHYDSALKRMVVKESLLLGDRIQLEAVTQSDPRILVRFYSHEANQAMAEAPRLESTRQFELTSKGLVNLIE